MMIVRILNMKIVRIFRIKGIMIRQDTRHKDR